MVGPPPFQSGRIVPERLGDPLQVSGNRVESLERAAGRVGHSGLPSSKLGAGPVQVGIGSRQPRQRTEASAGSREAVHPKTVP